MTFTENFLIPLLTSTAFSGVIIAFMKHELSREKEIFDRRLNAIEFRDQEKQRHLIEKRSIVLYELYGLMVDMQSKVELAIDPSTVEERADLRREATDTVSKFLQHFQTNDILLTEGLDKRISEFRDIVLNSYSDSIFSERAL